MSQASITWADSDVEKWDAFNLSLTDKIHYLGEFTMVSELVY